jgi:DNA-binding NarL/FixJ family response regulator
MNPFDNLTRTQRRVAQRVALGGERLDVSKELGINPKTFDSHRSRVLRALGLRNGVELARLAIAYHEVPAPVAAEELPDLLPTPTETVS